MKKAKVLVAAMLAVSMLAGCGASDGGNTGGSKSEGSSSGTSEGSANSGKTELVVNISSEPPFLNSILNTSQTGGEVLKQCMEGLVQLDKDNKPIPGMAESWEQSEDKKTVTFKLRDDAKWSNGEPVTAKDFKFALDQLFTTTNGAQYASTWASKIQGAEELMKATETSADSPEAKEAFENVGYKAVDDYTFEVKLTGPYDYFVPLTAFYNFLPVNQKAFEEAGGIDKYATEADNIVCNGAFVIKDWVHEDSVVLEKNPDYYNADAVKLEKITMRMIADSNTAINEFQAGGIDMIGLPGDQVQIFKDEGRNVNTYADGSVWYLQYNTQLPGLNNAKVRKALTLGVNAQGFIDSILLNDSKVATSFTPAAVSSGEFKEKVGDLIVRSEDYSEAKALLEEGLKEEGMKVEDLKLVMITDEGDTAAKNCAYVQEQLKANLGVNMEIEQMTFKTRLQRQHQKDFSVVFAGWSPDYDDPMTFMDLWVTGGGNNDSSYANPKYDELITKANQEADTDKRTELLIEAEKMLAEDCPIGVIYYRGRDYVLADGLEGIIRTAFVSMDLRFAEFK